MKHCCIEMEGYTEFHCKAHQTPYNCPDQLMAYNAKFDEYGIIIHDGGTSLIYVSFCPWCGKKLPESKRDEWFDIIDELGIDPAIDEIPTTYLSDEWYRSS